MKQKRTRKGIKKSLKDNAENLSFTETESSTEDLNSKDAIRECMDDNGFDEKNVISRVKLF